jgi:hypothetical protein
MSHFLAFLSFSGEAGVAAAAGRASAGLPVHVSHACFGDWGGEREGQRYATHAHRVTGAYQLAAVLWPGWSRLWACACASGVMGA